ncbi:MAG: glycosyltransferase family 4 protein [Novosphingobium sp.]|uniref:glycosyltransferase family 4 protein n=1 Tax=Novosphingobium sp. TaxID=1874826 RepID=UPI0030167DDD
MRISAYGRFCEQKGFDTLVRAVRAGWFGDCELLLGGFGPQATLLRALAGDCAQIRFTGRVERVADFLDACDVVAVPSRWEAYGMVATEAREAGRPILVSPVDGLPEQAEGAGLLVDFTDPESIAQALAQITARGLQPMAAAARRQTADSARRTREDWTRLLEPQLSRKSSAAASMIASASSL